MTNPYTSYFQNLETVNACLQKKEEISRSGEILRIKKELAVADKPLKLKLGQELNTLKKFLEVACDQRIRKIQEFAQRDNFQEFDPTFFSSEFLSNDGKLHPVTLVEREIIKIFETLGFDIIDGPLVVTQKDNFTDLNMPHYHPARAMQDTFYLEEKDRSGENYVLRTHTTALDVPYGKQHQPPFKMVSTGKVFRNENIDSTHDIIFHQVECLLIDREVSLSQLKTLIKEFYSKLFSTNTLQVRFRPSYFPYTIPSMEVDISNPFKNLPGGKLKDQDWIEAGGSGLVHPDVIKNMGLNPNEWQGLAFGFGIDRMTQLKLEILGLSQFFDGNLKFLKGSAFPFKYFQDLN